MTDRKAFVYTIVTFMLLTLVSYIANAQTQRVSLQQAVNMAIIHNRDTGIFEIAPERIDDNIQKSRGADLTSANMPMQTIHFFQAPVFSISDKNANDLAMVASYNILPVRNTIPERDFRPLRTESHGSQFVVSDKKVLIANMVKQAYIQILGLQEKIKLQQERIIRNEKTLEQAKLLLTKESALPVDTLSVYKSIEILRPDLLKLSAAVKARLQNLQHFIGLDSLQTMELSDSLSLPEFHVVPTESEVYERAMRQRADLQVLAIQAQLAEQQLQEVAPPMKPGVSLLAQYLVQKRINNFDQFEEYHPSSTILASQAAAPIVNRNGREEKMRWRQFQAKTNNVLEHLRLEVNQVVASLAQTSARIHPSMIEKEAARISYEQTQSRYQQGLASTLELLDAELVFTTAQSQHLEAVYNYWNANISLQKTVGQL